MIFTVSSDDWVLQVCPVRVCFIFSMWPFRKQLYMYRQSCHMTPTHVQSSWSILGHYNVINFELYLAYDVMLHFQKQMYSDACHHMYIPMYVDLQTVVIQWYCQEKIYVTCENALHSFYWPVDVYA